MDTQIIAAIIGAVATIVGAVIAAVFGIRASRRRGGTDSGGASTQASPPQEATPPRQSSGEPATTGGPVLKEEPQTHIVDPMEGDFATISEAIRAAAPKDRILVRPGWYREGMVVDKPLEIIGDGNTKDIVVRSDGKHALEFSTTVGSVSNLTLQQVSDNPETGAVVITQGRLTLTQCDISNRGLYGVYIDGGADPILRNNRIHDNENSGVAFHDNSLGVLEQNDIFGNGTLGVSVATGSDPVVHNNRIHDNKGVGVIIYKGGKGAFEKNDIFAHNIQGVWIKDEGSYPTMRNNRIHDNKQGGVLIDNGGGGILEDNTFSGHPWLIGAIRVQGHKSKANVIRARNKNNGKDID